MREEYITICPKCGDYNDGTILCINCGTRKIKTEYTYDDLQQIKDSIPYLEFHDDDTNEFHPILESFYNELREKYVFHSPLFDQEEYDKFVLISKAVYTTGMPEHQRQLYAEYSKKQDLSRKQRQVGQYSPKRNVVKCPKCKSTQIQLVKRKWSPLMGVFTNKVDRVCMNCKNKF